MPYSIKIIRGLDEIDPKVKVVILDLLEEIEKNTRETVKRSDFDELKAAFTDLTKTVHELAQAQKKSEERLTRVEAAIEHLTEAQKKSEERLTRVEAAIEHLTEAQKKSEERLDEVEITVKELTEAQKKTDLAIKELTEAQKKTDLAIKELTEAQKKTDLAIKELTEAQKRTEKRLDELTKTQKNTIERLEGISNSVGYSLENNAYKSLPSLLKNEGITVESKIIRRYYDEDQLNIWGSGKKNGKTILIIGEVKVRPSKKEINKFLRIAEKIMQKEKKDVFPVFVAHDYHPEVEKYLIEKGIKYYWSYELE